MDRQQPTTRSLYKELLRRYLSPQWRRVLLMTILVLSTIALQLVNPQIMRRFIDTVTTGGDLTALLQAASLFIGIAILNQAIGVLSTYVSENVAWTATNHLRTDLVRHCLGLDMGFHKTHTSGEMIERIDGDVNILSTFFSQSIIHLLGNFLLLLGIVVLLWREDWRIGVALGTFTVIAMVAITKLRGLAVIYWERAREKETEFFGFLSEQIGGTADLRANGATSYVLRRFHHLLSGWFPLARRASMAGYSLWSMMHLLTATGTALALLIGSYLLGYKVISLGTVYLIFNYIGMLNDPLEQIRTQLQQLQQAGAGIERVRKLFETRTAITDGRGISLPHGPLQVNFADVVFSYNDEDIVLKHLSFTLKPGKILGILGRTGSGKTTIARLLLRFYDPQQGNIRLGEVPLVDTALHDLRTHIGMVTQDVQLFHATIRDNLTFFNQTISDQCIEQALYDLGLEQWYRSLPDGLETELGSDGAGLSAGETQLLAFTRVFLGNPGLIILDEASSRLDPATEKVIESAVDKLLGGRTGIIIAHRLATIQRADEIMIIEDGRIVEYGERTALLADSGSRFSHLLQTGMEEVLA